MVSEKYYRNFFKIFVRVLTATTTPPKADWGGAYIIII